MFHTGTLCVRYNEMRNCFTIRAEQSEKMRMIKRKKRPTHCKGLPLRDGVSEDII